LTLLLRALETGSSGRLIVDSVSNIGPHYARTLREWRRRFLRQFESVIVPALIAEYPDAMGGSKGREEIEVFKRKWICEFALISV
jgi:cyclopropane-fatty-acyl-phospholipid synthase